MMSERAIQWVLEHSKSRLGARLVLLCVAYHLDFISESAFVDIPKIATQCRMNPYRAVQNIWKLVAAGELSTSSVRNDGGTSSSYFCLPLFSAWKKGQK
jgi:ribosome-associated toxin RatA of RatAB toxin-antitoxin module